MTMEDGGSSRGVSASPPAVVALGYRRVSSRDQLDGYSMEGQERAITAWCQNNHVVLERMYGDADANESGKDLERPVFKDLLRRIDEGGVGLVIVTKVDRLTRSISDMSRIIEDWDRRGIRMVFCQEPFPTDGSSNATLILLFAWIAEQERRRIVGRVVPGLQARVRAGLPPTRIALGYRLGRELRPDGRMRQVLEIDPESAPIVRAIFSKAAETEWGARRLAIWASKQFKPRTFSYGAVANMLANPLYCGVLQAQVAESIFRMPDNHEPIIDLPTFLAVQRRLGQRSADRKVGLRADASSLLGGIARCGLCGRAIILRARATVPDEADTYVCASALTAIPCGLPAHQVGPVDTFAYDQLLCYLQSQWQLLSELVVQGVDRIPEFLDQRRERAVLLQNEARRERARFIQRVEEGELSPDGLVRERHRLDRQEAEASALLTKVDGWSYLANLVAAQTERTGAVPSRPEERGERRFLPLTMPWAVLKFPDRRRLVKACTTSLTICTDFPFVSVTFHESPAAWTLMGEGIARQLALRGGIPLPAQLPEGFTVVPGGTAP